MGDYAAAQAVWESQPITPGVVIGEPVPLFAKLDPSVVEEELARLDADEPRAEPAAGGAAAGARAAARSRWPTRTATSTSWAATSQAQLDAARGGRHRHRRSRSASTSRRRELAAALAAEHDSVWAAVALHPNEAGRGAATDEALRRDRRAGSGCRR